MQPKALTLASKQDLSVAGTLTLTRSVKKIPLHPNANAAHLPVALMPNIKIQKTGAEKTGNVVTLARF